LNPLIFLSYSSKNKLIADAICSRLENQNIRCWIAPRDVHPGADYSNQIADALERSTVMVMVFSSDSNRSRHVKSEIDRAFSLGKVIIPFRVEDVEIDKGLAYYLAKTHWLDAVTKPLEQHIDRLAGTIRQMVGVEVSGSQISPPPAPSPLPPPPPQPSPPQAAPPVASSKTPWIIAGVAAVLFAIIAVGGLLFFFLNQRKTETQVVATAPSKTTPAPNVPAPVSTPSPSAQSKWQGVDESATAREPENDPMAGDWQIAEATTVTGESYTGNVSITPMGSRYSLQWQAAGSDYGGIGLVRGNKLCVAFGLDTYSVILYQILPDGTLKGRWASSAFAAGDPDAFENATGGAAGKVEGKYTVEGLNSDGTSYQGKLKITKTSQTFQLEWEVLGTTIRGVGIRVGDELFAASGDKDPLGVVGYTFEGGRAKGVWTLAGEGALGKENLKR
jgi:hypothetical protein